MTVPLLFLTREFVYGAFGRLVNVTLMAARQAVAPDGTQSRVAATINFAGRDWPRSARCSAASSHRSGRCAPPSR
ncbi:hypothetical protein ACFXPV_37220 [Streptomyces sp. NPDC059118]|uniref:hypothetical protein n=1 Tax=unclassified Streptomyces TaxID=2593676 RepID=UPI0036C5F1AE